MTIQEIAESLGVDRKTIQRWQKVPGFPCKCTDAMEVARWRINYLDAQLRQRPRKSSESPEGEAEKFELELKNRERELKIRIHEYKLKCLEREFAPLTLITDAIVRTATAAKSRLESWLPKLKLELPELPPEALEKLERHVAELSNELANVEPDFSDYLEGSFEGSEEWVDTLSEADS